MCLCNVIINGTGLPVHPVEQNRGRKMTPREQSLAKLSQNYSNPKVKRGIQTKIENVKLVRAECCPLPLSTFPHLQEKLGKGICLVMSLTLEICTWIRFILSFDTGTLYSNVLISNWFHRLNYKRLSADSKAPTPVRTSFGRTVTSSKLSLGSATPTPRRSSINNPRHSTHIYPPSVSICLPTILTAYPVPTILLYEHTQQRF